RMAPEWKNALASLSPDPKYKQAIESLYQEAQEDNLIPYRQLAQGRVSGIIVGIGVIGIRRNPQGHYERPGRGEYAVPTNLTVLDLSAAGNLTAQSPTNRTYFIVDD